MCTRRTLGGQVADRQPGDTPRSRGRGAAGDRLSLAKAFDVEGVRGRLESGSGGYEVVHTSPSVEIGVYVLVAPEPDRQQPHEDDEVYVVLEGRGVLDVEGKRLELNEGHAAFVPAGAEHRFVAYESLSLLVIFERFTRKR
jgi:mannose-6-phosphate isomerase-like protein (cupin superfamily)